METIRTLESDLDFINWILHNIREEYVIETVCIKQIKP